jgi:hypothetical protein
MNSGKTSTHSSNGTLHEEILVEDAAILLLHGLIGIHWRFLVRQQLGKLRQKQQVVVTFDILLLQERFKVCGPCTATVEHEGDEGDLIQLQRDPAGRRAPLEGLRPARQWSGLGWEVGREAVVGSSRRSGEEATTTGIRVLEPIYRNRKRQKLWNLCGPRKRWWAKVKTRLGGGGVRMDLVHLAALRRTKLSADCINNVTFPS